jgi:outer membrane receptor protein involved in Fe transport
VNTSTLNSSSTETTDKALFGSASLDVTDKLNIGAELRYQSEHLISRNLISGFVGDTTNDAYVPRFTVNYKFSPDVMAYGV